jgi:hypothetical protein
MPYFCAIREEVVLLPCERIAGCRGRGWDKVLLVYAMAVFVGHTRYAIIAHQGLQPMFGVRWWCWVLTDAACGRRAASGAARAGAGTCRGIAGAAAGQRFLAARTASFDKGVSTISISAG